MTLTDHCLMPKSSKNNGKRTLQQCNGSVHNVSALSPPVWQEVPAWQCQPVIWRASLLYAMGGNTQTNLHGILNNRHGSCVRSIEEFDFGLDLILDKAAVPCKRNIICPSSSCFVGDKYLPSHPDACSHRFRRFAVLQVSLAGE